MMRTALLTMLFVLAPAAPRWLRRARVLSPRDTPRPRARMCCHNVQATEGSHSAAPAMENFGEVGAAFGCV